MKNKVNKYLYGARTICPKCERPLLFYPADGKNRVAMICICKDCAKKLRKLVIKMGKPQYWTKGAADGKE